SPGPEMAEKSTSLPTRLEATTIWKQGSTARLQCTVKGSPELHTTWFLNNSELSTSGRHAVGLKDGVATLEIHNVMLTDSGNYTCEVLNECGCESCSIKVTVKGAVRGSVAVLECEIAGSAPLEVSWKKNKKRLSSDKKYRIVSQGSLASLEIQSFESADTGEYECVVSNEVGSVTSKSVLKQKALAVISHWIAGLLDLSRWLCLGTKTIKKSTAMQNISLISVRVQPL
uniref:Ig-like domain-containing protein n=1 Tax=Oreochromis aureus TaxID=47969 RepID=A0A668SIM8_OREAU